MSLNQQVPREQVRPSNTFTLTHPSPKAVPGTQQEVPELSPAISIGNKALYGLNKGHMHGM